jgi:hypothetical protein
VAAPHQRANDNCGEDEAESAEVDAKAENDDKGKPVDLHVRLPRLGVTIRTSAGDAAPSSPVFGWFV